MVSLEAIAIEPVWVYGIAEYLWFAIVAWRPSNRDNYYAEAPRDGGDATRQREGREGETEGDGVLNARAGYFSLPDVLYKYVPPERIQDLRTRTIKCTLPEHFADIFDSHHILEPSPAGVLNVEGQLVYFMAADPRTGLPHYPDPEFLAWIKRSAAKYPGYVVDAVCVMPAAATQAGFRAGFMEMAYAGNPHILSLSSDPLAPTMWDFYAGGYSGFVLGFDTNSTMFQGQARTLLRRVIYQDEPSRGPAEVAVWRRWVIKKLQYAFEAEWRGLFWSGFRSVDIDGGKTIEVLDVPKGTIKQVILGPRMEASVEKCLSDLLDPGVEVLRCFQEGASLKLIKCGR